LANTNMKTIAVFDPSQKKFKKDNLLFSKTINQIGDVVFESLVFSEDYRKEFFKKYARRKDIQVLPADILDTEKADGFLFWELPKKNNKCFQTALRLKKPMYLIAAETKIIRPDSYNPENHNYFKKVFTWDDSLVDNKKYIKINYSFTLPDPESLNFKLEEKTKLCTLITANKFAKDPLELYSERIRAIRWFEKNHPNDFDLYGIGWDKYYFHGSFLGINLLRLNRLKFLAKLLKPNYPSYKGTVLAKREVYKKYKFAVCYENARGVSGYITEKIFDCFFGSCVPIYLGDENIARHIPKNTFIDKRNFKTYDELYQYIKNMPDAEYKSYLDNLKNALASGEFYPFSAECFANTICDRISEDF
jgi:alpha(1,3/1,4) fucosyltransferase